jgi:glycosyltransferase involved in cell wall biosynthesis
MKRFYHSLYGGKMFSGASAVIATAEQEVEELIRGGIAREKILLRRNGVVPPRVPPLQGAFRSAQRISGTARVVLFLGRLSAKKSPDLLLAAFASLPPELAGRELVLVFAGPDEAGTKHLLEQEAAKLNVSARVRFVAPLFGADKWNAYRDADVFVLPSQNENFGNTAAEAAAVGTPVVLTENCGIAPMLEGSAAIVVPHEQNAVARAIESLLSDSDLHGRLSAGGKSVAARLGWDEPVLQMEALYSKLAVARLPVGQ